MDVLQRGGLLFVMNCLPLIEQRFPREVVGELVRTYGDGNVRLDSTILNSVDDTVPLFLPLNRDRAGSGSNGSERYVLLNSKDIWVAAEPIRWKPPPVGRTVFAAKHPRQLLSMQYHGYTPEQRAFLRTLDFSMRLIDTR